MLRSLCVLTCTAVAIVPSFLCAQSSERKGGPEKGTWAAEASVGGALTQGVGQGGSLIRFVGPKTALIGGLAFSRSEVENNVTFGQSTTRFTSAFTTIALQAGLRRYTRTGLGLRPVYGAGLLVTRQSVFGDAGNNVGGYAEAGAAWFFNPHVSMGVLGGVSAARQDGGWSVGGSLARLTGAVYF
jgi:hypothetical protein